MCAGGPPKPVTPTRSHSLAITPRGAVPEMGAPDCTRSGFILESMADRLFEADEETSRTGVPPHEAPLAVRMRPRDLAELVGQSHLLEPASALRVAIESGKPHSAIFYGPPGTGKTTLARILAAGSRGAFEELSAVNAGRAEVREVIARAEERRASGRPTIFFLDETPRFNKAQQDALPPAVEEGLVT